MVCIVTKAIEVLVWKVPTLAPTPSNHHHYTHVGHGHTSHHHGTHRLKHIPVKSDIDFATAVEKGKTIKDKISLLYEEKFSDERMNEQNEYAQQM